METGTIDIDELAGGIDLYLTLESGQSYLWTRSDGQMYTGTRPEDAWYETVIDGEVIRVRQQDDQLVWQGTRDVEPLIRDLLRLDDDLPAILSTMPTAPLFEHARHYASGLRVVRDPAFPTLISFICSAQMRVSRIHSMITRLRETLGDTVTLDGRSYHAFPTPDQLAAASEETLRELKLGYRAPYVADTADMVATGTHPADAAGRSYEAAREFLTQFVGVGQKVADCVLLFSLGYLEAVPLDTWIRTAIEQRFPDADRGSYAATSAAIREKFGGEYAGYVQTYVFHYLRTTDAL